MKEGSKFNFDAFYSSKLSGPDTRPSMRIIPYDFAAAHPDMAEYPVQEICEAASRAMDKDGPGVSRYPEGNGYLGLREIVARKMFESEGLKIETDRIVITGGSLQGLCMLADSFIDPGETVITEEFTYLGTLRAFSRSAPRIIGIPMDDDGLRTDHLKKVLRELEGKGTRPKFIYTITNFQNPTGVVLSLQRRKELLELSYRFGVPIMEDDAYGDLLYEGEAVPSIYSLCDNDSVIRLGTFSKIIGAGMRLGWLIAPERVVPRMLLTKVDGGTNSFASRVVAQYMEDHMEERVKQIVDLYRRKRDAMLKALEEGLGDGATWTRPRGGLFIWLKLPKGSDAKKLQEAAAAKGISYIAGEHFSPSGGGKEFIRLAFSHPTPEKIYEGTRLLCQCIKRSVAS